MLGIGGRVRVNRARGTLALMVAFVSALLVAGAVSRTPDAHGAPAPSRTPKEKPPGHDKEPSPTPTPTPSPTPTPRPTEVATPTPSPSGTPSEDAAETSSPKVEGARIPGSNKTKAQPAIWWDIGPSFSGGYTSASLMQMEQHLSQLGASESALRKVYAPFIVVGPSNFSDTWGSVRHNEGNSLRPHLGQDVFCESGAEVLAAEPGRVQFVTDRLGGTVVRLHRDDGGYWYYAHLSGYAEGLTSGDRVKTGDVIGHCGATGNAQGGTPHVHFGSYPGPVNPMEDLIGWLEKAEAQARRAIERRAADSAGVGTVVVVYDKKLVDPCTRSVPADDTNPLELILTSSL